MPLEAIYIETSCLRKTWSPADQKWATKIINEHFEAHDDWTDASGDMCLTYKEGVHYSQVNNKPVDSFAAFVVTRGDFYAAVGILIIGFALTDNGTLLLIGKNDDDFSIVFFPIN